MQSMRAAVRKFGLGTWVGGATIIALAACKPPRASDGASVASEVAAIASVQCPSDLANLARVDFVHLLGVDEGTAVDLREAIAGIADVQGTLALTGDRLAGACSRIAGDLDAPIAAGSGLVGSCQAAIQGAASAPAVVVESLRRAADPSLFAGCGLPMKAMSTCVGRCLTGQDGVVSRVSCESPRRIGACEGTCSGICETQAPSQCEGECSGKCDAQFAGHCEGPCNGKCDGLASANASCAGECIGTCEGAVRGQCPAACRGLCRAAGPAHCAGTCVGTCSGAFSDEACVGAVDAPYGGACNGRCEIYLFSQIECITAFATAAESPLPGAARDAATLAEFAQAAPLVAQSAQAVSHGLQAVLGTVATMGHTSGERAAATAAALAKCMLPAVGAIQDAVAQARANVETAESLRKSFSVR